MLKIVFSLFVVLVSHAFAGLPNYDKPIMEARSSYTDGYYMPALTLFTDATPAINNNRDIAVPLSLIAGQTYSGIWTKWDGIVNLSYRRADGYQISSFKMNDEKELAFTVYDDFYFFDLVETKNEDGKIIFQSIKDQFNFQTISQIVKTKVGYSYKAHDESKVIGTQSFAGDIKVFATEGINNHSYLFAPAFNQKGESLSKMRLGEALMYDESRPDIIILKSAMESKIIAYDKDYKADSKWIKFRNGVGISDADHYVYVAIDSEGKSHILRNFNGVDVEIATEGEDLVEISNFAPVVNNKGQVAFKAVDKNGNTGIYIADEISIKRVINQNDIIEFLGKKYRISYGEHIPFGGNIGLNDRGDILINTGLADETGTKDLGRALIAIYTK